MKYIAYIFTISFLRLLAILPGKLLYLLSDLTNLILQHIVGYRKKVINKNLRNSFPKLNDKEIRKIRRGFYRNLSDVLLENGVIPFLSKRRLEKLYSFSNVEVLNRYYEQGRDIILITAHYNNWEWASPLAYSNGHLVLGVYKPLKNKYFDKAIKNARTRFGAAAVPMASIARALITYRNQGVPTLTGMVADQSPVKKQVRYWTNFLNQKTPVFSGSEKLAIKRDAVVVFMKVRRPKRGRYVAEIELITENPKETAPNEITERHTRILENLILENPSSWLWSHRRWKYSYEDWEKAQVRS